MSASGGKGTHLVIGLAAIVGAVVLMYFSASPSLLCVRADGRVDCAVTAKALNLVAISEARVSGVRSALTIASATGRSRTPPHLNFRTDAGDVDLGYFSQRFATNVSELDAFVRESTEPELRLETGVTFRNVTAYAAAGFLGLIGLLVVLGLRSGKRPGRSVYDNAVN